MHIAFHRTGSPLPTGATPRRFDLEMQAHARRILIVSFGALALAMLAAQVQAQQVEVPPVAAVEMSPAVQPAVAGIGQDLQAPHGGLSIGVAFARADANGDGQLSSLEADRLPAIGTRFDEFDKDRNGLLNIVEFESGALGQP